MTGDGQIFRDEDLLEQWKSAIKKKHIGAPAGELWVFGYASLIWNPGFEYCEASQATVHGLHRALCVWSWRYRGTPARPGLVMGLDHGGCCVGRAYRVATNRVADTVDYLQEREMFTGVYHPAYRNISLADGRKATALCFVVDRHHRQYAGRLDVETAARTVAGATGQKGCNRSYVLNTFRHLQELGVNDPALERVCRLL